MTRLPSWLPRALLAMGLLAIVATLIACPYLPFQDVPNHVKVLSLDRALTDGASSRYLHSADGIRFGYSLSVLLSRALRPVLGTAGIVRIICIVSAVGIPLAAIPLARSCGAPPAWAAVLALPLGLSWPLRVGLVPYVLALPFVELGVAAALWAGAGGTWRRGGALCAAAVGAYLAHPMAFAFLPGAAGLALLLPRPGGVSLRQRAVRLGWALAPALALMGSDLVRRELSMLPDADATALKSALWWRPLDMALGHVVTRGFGVTGPGALPYYAPLLLVLVAGLTVAWRRGAASPPWAVVAIALAGTFGTILLPESRENVFLIGSRTVIVGVVFSTVLAARAFAGAPWLKLATIPAVALSLGSQIHEVVERAAVVQQVVGAQRPQVDGAYLPLQVPRCSDAAMPRWGNYDPLRHVWAYALGADGVAPYIFAASRYQPVWFAQGALTNDLRAPNEHLLNANEERRPGQSCDDEADERLAGAGAWSGAYRGLLVSGRQPELDQAIERSGLVIDERIAPGMVLVKPEGPPPGLRVDFGTLGGAAALRSGFYGDEVIDGANVQWSRGRESTLVFTESHVVRGYMLQVVAASPIGASVSVEIDDGFTTTLQLSDEMEEAVAYVPGSALHVGENHMRLRYSKTFAPEKGWFDPPRELSVLYQSLSLSPAPPAADLDVGSKKARKLLSTGFSEDESIDERSAAWSRGKESVLHLDLAGGAPSYTLTLTAKAITPQSVSVTFNGRWTGTLEVGASWDAWTLAVPGDAVLPGRNEIRFAYSSPVRPADRGEGDDKRLLAVAFDEVELVPTPARFEVDCAAPEAARALRSGFSGPETIDGRSAVWSDGAWSDVDVTLAGEKVAHELKLQVTARIEQRVTIAWNGAFETSLSIPAHWADLTAVVPAGVVRPGANSLRFTYSDPGHPGGDTRLLAVAYHSIELSPVRADGRLDFGAPAARALLGQGWGADETMDGRAAVWSVGSFSETEMDVEPSRLAGESPCAGDAALRFTASPFVSLAPLPVQIQIDGQPVTKVDLTEGWQTYAVRVPGSLLRSGANQVRWTYGRTARPRDLVPGSTDARALAVAFDEAWFGCAE